MAMVAESKGNNAKTIKNQSRLSPRHIRGQAQVRNLPCT